MFGKRSIWINGRALSVMYPIIVSMEKELFFSLSYSKPAQRRMPQKVLLLRCGLQEIWYTELCGKVQILTSLVINHDGGVCQLCALFQDVVDAPPPERRRVFWRTTCKRRPCRGDGPGSAAVFA